MLRNSPFKMQNLQKTLGDVLKQAGTSLYIRGSQLQGSDFSLAEHSLPRFKRVLPFQNTKPSIKQGVWIAPNASVIGKVEIGQNTSIWYGAVLRGDVQDIKIGSKSNIQDRVVVHVASGIIVGDPRPTKIGNNVTVEPGVILHACLLEDDCKIEMGSKILDGAIVGARSIIGAGSLVGSGTKIPSGEFWAGSPAKYVRTLTQQEMEAIIKTADDMHKLAVKHDEAHRSMERPMTQRIHDKVLEDEYTKATMEHKYIKYSPNIEEVAK